MSLTGNETVRAALEKEPVYKLRYDFPAKVGRLVDDRHPRSGLAQAVGGYQTG
jgi:hypothetical protein